MTICQSSVTFRTCRQMDCRSRVNKNGVNFQISSFGQISRRPPPAKPQPIAKGSAPHSPAMSAGMPTPAPTSAPAYGPATSPVR